MIRINLLGVPKPKKGKRAAVPSMAGEGPNPLLVGVVVLLVAAVAMGAWWWKLNNDAKAIAQRMDLAVESPAGPKCTVTPTPSHFIDFTEGGGVEGVGFG